MQSSLGLAGDLDDVDFIEDVEQSFALRFNDDELRQCQTVGDLFELVRAQLPESPVDGNGCATAMAFYRVRRALQPSISVQLRPSTPMHEITSQLSVRSLYRLIESKELQAPHPVISMLGCAAILLTLGLPLAGL